MMVAQHSMPYIIQKYIPILLAGKDQQPHSIGYGDHWAVELHHVARIKVDLVVVVDHALQVVVDFMAERREAVVMGAAAAHRIDWHPEL
jgi:hypothetical protein